MKQMVAEELIDLFDRALGLPWDWWALEVRFRLVTVPLFQSFQWISLIFWQQEESDIKTQSWQRILHLWYQRPASPLRLWIKRWFYRIIWLLGKLCINLLQQHSARHPAWTSSELALALAELAGHYFIIQGIVSASKNDVQLSSERWCTAYVKLCMVVVTSKATRGHSFQALESQ
jgi:hypothetical protein